MNPRRTLAAFLLLAGCSSSPEAPPASLWAGVAVVEITPDRPVPLGGYGRRAGKPLQGVHDPLYAKALWLETRERSICLVTTDLIGTTLEIRDAIRPEGADLILAASHTHSGPGALARGFWQLAMGRFDAEFHAELVAKLKRVVREARAVLLPARIAFARGQAPGFNRNRRRPGGPVDPELQILLVTDALSRPLAIVANYSAHPTILSDRNFLVSADWPGFFQRALEERTGAPVLFTNGAQGDLAPRAPSGRDDFEKCASLGEQLAARAADLLGNIEKTQSEVRITYVERGVELPSPTLPLAPRKSVLGVLDLNGVKMFCFPGEPAVELGLELKRRFPGAWILGLANDHLGYFLAEEDYRNGGYERTVSFYGPRMGPWLVERFVELGERVHAQDRPGEPEGGRGQDDDRR